MVMRVNQAGKKDMTGQIENFIGSIRELLRGCDLLNEAIPDIQTTINDLTFLVIKSC